MRPVWVLLLLAIPSSAAAWLEDAEGDPSIVVNDQALAQDPVAHSALDLIGLDIVEEADTFTFTLGLRDIAPEGGSSLVVCDLLFEHNGRSFWIASRPRQGWSAYLWSKDGEGPWNLHPLPELEAVADAANDLLSIKVARDEFADAFGAAPTSGRFLEDVHVMCHGPRSLEVTDGAQVPLASVQDRIPDAGQPVATWSVLVGAAQSGHALLSSPVPFRASNGEATTYRYNVTASNLGASADDFVFRVTNVPAATNITLTDDRLRIAGGASTSFDVWVTVPFAHEHGTKRSFVLEMTSASDPASVGRIELGVRYLSVPQPSGHHDVVFIHGGAAEEGLGTEAEVALRSSARGIFGGTSGYLNTLEEDPSDSHEPITAPWFSLEPSLLVGIDADLERTGTVHLDLASRLPVDDVEVSAQVNVFLGPKLGVRTLAILEPTLISIDPDGTSFEAPLIPQEESDLIPFAPGMNLQVDIIVNPATGLNPNGVWVLPGSWLQLPLRDYHDPVEGMPPTADAVVLAGEPAASSSSGPARGAPLVLWLPLAAIAAILRRRGT